MTGDDPHRPAQLPDTSGLQKTEIIVFRGHHSGFLSSVRETGAALIEIGGNAEELRQALSDRTAAVLWFAGDFWPDDALEIGLTVSIAHELGVPVIVDSADQIQPVSNLWHFTRDCGADLAIISGGKGLCGPQSSGLIVGRADLVRACRANSGPFHSIGRPAKVGKEEMAGLLAAVEFSLSRDADADLLRYESIVEIWVSGASGCEGVVATRSAHSHSGQPIPRAILDFVDTSIRDAIITFLWKMNPRIAVLPEGATSLALNPQAIQPGQETLVLESLKTAISHFRLPTGD